MIGLLTARQVAELIGVSTETILRWTRHGDLPAIRLPGGALRFRMSNLELWLDQRATAERGSANHPARTAARGHATGVGVGLVVPTTPDDEE